MSDEWTAENMPHICQSYIDRAEKAERERDEARAALWTISYTPVSEDDAASIARKALEAGDE